MKKIFLAGLLVLGLATTSCDSYLDINEDPNSPSQENMTPSMMLPAAEMNLAHSYGDYLRTVGGYFFTRASSSAPSRSVHPCSG